MNSYGVSFFQGLAEDVQAGKKPQLFADPANLTRALVVAAALSASAFSAPSHAGQSEGEVRIRNSIDGLNTVRTAVSQGERVGRAFEKGGVSGTVQGVAGVLGIVQQGFSLMGRNDARNRALEQQQEREARQAQQIRQHGPGVGHPVVGSFGTPAAAPVSQAQEERRVIPIIETIESNDPTQ